MQNFAPNMDVLTPTKSNRRKHLFVPIALVIVLLASLFSFAGSQEDANPKPKTVYAADTGGTGGGGLVWCRSQAWVDKIQADLYNGKWWRTGDWLDFVWRIGSKICTPRPDNPAVQLDCDKPEITVALLVDRSNSVIADGSNKTPELYTKSLNTLIDEFYDRFTPSSRKGKINFLIYAFGTKSVLQNDTTDNLRPVLSSNLITDASTPSGRAAMLDTISKIHFRDDAAFPDKNNHVAGFQSKTLNPFDRARAYDVDSETSGGEYGMTNWHDAFISVMDAGSSAKYNHPGDAGIGKRIDLAVMVTDGLPTASDSTDWTWTPGTFKGSDTTSYNPAADGIDIANPAHVDSWNANYSATDDLYRITTGIGGRALAATAVDLLRSGASPHSGPSSVARDIPARPPISVKGIVVTTNPSPAARSAARNYANDLFGDPNGENFFFATDFTTTLEDQIKSLVTEVIKESTCPFLNEPVENAITLDVIGGHLEGDGSITIKPKEGDTQSIDIEYRITNNGDGPLTFIRLCTGLISHDPDNGATCKPADTWKDSGDISLAPGESYSFIVHYTAVFGAPDYDFEITAIGTSSAEEFVAGSFPNSASLSKTIHYRPERRNLPS